MGTQMLQKLQADLNSWVDFKEVVLPIFVHHKLHSACEQCKGMWQDPLALSCCFDVVEFELSHAPDLQFSWPFQSSASFELN